MTTLQLFAISTGNNVGPFQLSTLRSAYKITGTFSLRSLINKVDASTVILWVAVRDFSILNSAANPSQLASQWNTAQPSKATLVGLSQLLGSVGASIVYLSPDWRMLGIRGNTAALGTLGSLRLEYRTAPESGAIHVETPEGGWALVGAGATAVLTGTGQIGGYLMAPAATAGAADIGGTIVLGTAAGLIGIGIALGAYGIYDLATSDTSQNVPDAVDGGIPAQIGAAPEGVDPNNPPDTAVDAGSLPDAPPSCPPGCPSGDDGDGGNGG